MRKSTLLLFLFPLIACSSFINENDGLHAFWSQFSLLPLTFLPSGIDEFNDLMQKILEGVEN